MSWAAVAVGAVSLGYGIYSNEHNKNKAKKLEAANKRPDYNVQQPILDNQTLAENNAQQGLSESSKEIATDNLNSGLSSSIDALLQAGGGMNSISDLYTSYGNNLKNLATLDNELRFKNQQILMGQNERMGQEFDKEFQINTWADYANKIQRAAELRMKGQSDLRAGESAAISSIPAIASGISPREKKKQEYPFTIDANKYDAVDNVNTERKTNYLIDDMYNSSNSAWV